MAKIDNWSLAPDPRGPAFRAPEARGKVLQGVVSGHEDHPDGAHVITTELRRVDTQDGRLFGFTRSGSIYELGEIDPGYEKAYPNARERVIKQFGSPT